MKHWTAAQVDALIASPKRLTLKASPPPKEAIEQEAFVAWARAYRYEDGRLYDDGWSSLNGAYLGPNGATHGARLKRQGMAPGYPDVGIDIPIAPYAGLRIEFKRINGPKPTGEQFARHLRLARRGYCVVVAYGFEEAKAATLRYLHLNGVSA